MSIREGDILRFSYSTEVRAKLFEPSHCFDGQLVAVKSDAGILLLDTYWLYQFQPRSDARRFTEQEATDKGTLTLVCNLNEVEKADKSCFEYYDDADVFDLSYQHRCYPYYAVRKGAVRSKAKMADSVHSKIQKERDAINSAVSSIEWLSKSLLKIQEGRLDEVYL